MKSGDEARRVGRAGRRCMDACCLNQAEYSTPVWTPALPSHTF